ncbi:MAG: ThiF family adenylyltransferase [Actinomycetales bacterium]|nr:ThiF family adenylyltransferase [Candidatus Lutibacillus vidarii]
MSETVHAELAAHLLRCDRQEDICLATYVPSTGATRTTRIIATVELPHEGEREVHGNATITGGYVLRVAGEAARANRGVVLLHSHPGGRGWQAMSAPDADCESSYAELVRQLTGLPLVGMTLAGDETWSARVWIDGTARWAGSVRRVGPTTATSWNAELVPAKVDERSQARTIAAWGEDLHRDITRLRVLVVGVGSVGLDIVQRLAATGLFEIGVMDYDHVEELNRDRMIGATRRDARLHRRKIDVAARLARQAATAPSVTVHLHPESICTATGLTAALDYDVIFSCVDRPWPRAVLNAIAYSDLIPVIDGGIAIDTLPNGGMRGATRRAQTVVPGRPCLSCSGQISMAEVSLEMSGDLDDPEYIRRAGREPVSGRPNVAALCAGVSASQLEQFVSLVTRPGGQPVPGPLRFSLAAHHLEHLAHATQPYCPAEESVALGDDRVDLTRELNPTGPEQASGARRWSLTWLWRWVRLQISTVVDRVIESMQNATVGEMR